MPTNDFIGFASSGSANIASQADYAAAAEQGIGMQPGPASSKLANKAWRQGANMSAAIGEMIKAQGIDALDNGDIATLSNNLVSALSAFLLPLSGGKMSGPIKGDGTSAQLSLYGAQDIDQGANLVLWGKDHPANPGYFALRAKDGVNNIQFVGRPNGELLWNNRYIPTFSTGTWTPVIDGRGTSGTVTQSFNKSIYVKNGPLVYCVVSGVYGPISGGSGSVVLRPSSFPYTIEGNGLSGTMFWNDTPYPMYYYTNDLIYFRKTDTVTDLICSDISSSKTFTMAFIYYTTD